MPFNIIRNDITKVEADAIVNTANPRPVIGAGTDSAVFKAAGMEKLLEERKRIGDIKPGDTAVTPAFGLNARYIIHTVGPVWEGGDNGEEDILRSCYRNALLTANRLQCESIAFPLISTGSYGFPKEKALRIALREIADFLTVSEMNIILVVFDRKSFDLSADLVEDVEQFIDENYVEEQNRAEYPMAGGPVSRVDRRAYSGRALTDYTLEFEADELEAAEPDEDESEMTPLARIGEASGEMTEDEFDAYFHHLYEQSVESAEPLEERALKSEASPAADEGALFSKSGYGLDDLMSGLGMTFQQKLLNLIDEKGFTDTQVYKRANVDRKLFSKIRCNPNYKPSKTTALAFAIALELNLDEAVDLLGRAGLALSPSSKSDLIVQYCLGNEIYDIFEVNALLFRYDQPLLCC